LMDIIFSLNSLLDGISVRVCNRKSAEDVLELAERTVKFIKELLGNRLEPFNNKMEEKDETS